MEGDVLDSRHLFDIRALAGPALRTAAPLGGHSTTIVREGAVDGERVRGRIAPGGGDWLLVDAAGTGHIDARFVIETDDGALIQTRYGGRAVLPGDAPARLRAGEPLAEADVYLRIAPTFAAPEPYGWLNGVQAVGIGRLDPGPDGALVVRYRVFELL
jgi:hypothetical protein